MKWQTYAQTTGGAAVKRLQKDVRSVTLGNNLGVSMLPSANLYIVIPMTTTRNTTTSANDIADVYFNDSASQNVADIRNQTKSFHKEGSNVKQKKWQEIECLPIRLKHINGKKTMTVRAIRTKARPVHQCSPNHSSKTPLW